MAMVDLSSFEQALIYDALREMYADPEDGYIMSAGARGIMRKFAQVTD